MALLTPHNFFGNLISTYQGQIQEIHCFYLPFPRTNMFKRSTVFASAKNSINCVIRMSYIS